MVNAVEFDIAESLSCLENIAQESSTVEVFTTEPFATESTSFTEFQTESASETNTSLKTLIVLRVFLLKMSVTLFVMLFILHTLPTIPNAATSLTHTKT